MRHAHLQMRKVREMRRNRKRGQSQKKAASSATNQPEDQPTMSEGYEQRREERRRRMAQIVGESSPPDVRCPFFRSRGVRLRTPTPGVLCGYTSIVCCSVRHLGAGRVAVHRVAFVVSPRVAWMLVVQGAAKKSRTRLSKGEERARRRVEKNVRHISLLA